jgi:hypothetical protein
MTARPAILATVAAALLLAACGGGPGGQQGGKDQSRDEKRAKYLDCLRKAGIKVHEQTTGRERGIQIEVPRGVSKTRMREIERVCARKTGGGPNQGRPLSREQQAQLLDQGLEFARCMRAHGVAMSDPKVEPGGGFSLGIDGSKADPDSPAFRRAQEACQALMPRKPGAPK